MSYVTPKTDDSMALHFMNLIAFYNVLPQLFKADSMEGFLNWYEKLAAIDSRSIYLVLLHRNVDVPEELKGYIYDRYKHLNGSDILYKKFYGGAQK